MTPQEHYQALLKRITTWAVEEECGKGKHPTTKEQEQAIVERLGYAMARAKIFHIDPSKHVQQSYFLKAKAPIVAAISGNKFGKTFALLTQGLIASLGCCPWDPDQSDTFNPLVTPCDCARRTMPFGGDCRGDTHVYQPPVRVGLVVMDYATALPQDIVPRLKELIPWDALVSSVSRVQGQIIDGIEFFNGSLWKILSHKQDDPTFEGWSQHLILWNEPPPHSKFVGAARGSMEFDAPHLMAMTPISEPWIYDGIYLKSHVVRTQADFDQIPALRPEMVCVEGSTYDNPYLTREAIGRFESRLHVSEKEARLFGKFSHLSGLIFKEFSREKHVRELATLV